jgi:hypothetical protein
MEGALPSWQKLTITPYFEISSDIYTTFFLYISISSASCLFRHGPVNVILTLQFMELLFV